MKKRKKTPNDDAKRYCDLLKIKEESVKAFRDATSENVDILSQYETILEKWLRINGKENVDVPKQNATPSLVIKLIVSKKRRIVNRGFINDVVKTAMAKIKSDNLVPNAENVAVALHQAIDGLMISNVIRSVDVVDITEKNASSLTKHENCDDINGAVNDDVIDDERCGDEANRRDAVFDVARELWRLKIDLKQEHTKHRDALKTIETKLGKLRESIISTMNREKPTTHMQDGSPVTLRLSERTVRPRIGVKLMRDQIVPRLTDVLRRLITVDAVEDESDTVDATIRALIDEFSAPVKKATIQIKRPSK